MKRLLLLLVIPVTIFAQFPWSPVIAKSRAIDWSVVGANIQSYPLCTSAQAGFTVPMASTSTTANINTAIVNCNTAAPNGTTLVLAAGTFSMTSVINLSFSNIVLRGQGADQTILKWGANSSSGCTNLPQTADLCLSSGANNWQDAPDNITTWTGGYAQGTTVLTVGSTTGMFVGALLILDQLNDTKATDTGFLYVNDDATQVVDNTPQISPGRGSTSSTPCTPDCNQQEYRRVVTINDATHVTIDLPIDMPNWVSGKSPHVWWANAVAANSGIENMTLDHTLSNDGAGIGIDNATNCWVRGIRSIEQVGQGAAGTGRDHIQMVNSSRISVIDSYFFGTRDAASLSYGLECFQCGMVLAQNNIFEHVISSYLIGNNVHSVWSYTFSTDHYFSLNDLWNIPGPPDQHDAAVLFNLFEGTEGSGVIEDDVHGSHDLNTYFRVYGQGRDNPLKTQNTMPAQLYAFSRLTNVVGSVFGEAGYNTNYQTDPFVNTPSGGNPCDTSVWNFGYPDGSCKTTGASGTATDSNVLPEIMRWCNWDSSHNAIQKNSAEVPSGISQFPNPVPAHCVLPASYYLKAKPAKWWGTIWGTPPWPAIGPGVNGGNVTSGTGAAANLGNMIYKIPARFVFENAPIDTTYNSLGNLTAASTSGTTATVTVSGSITAVTLGCWIYVTGVGVAGYNGRFKVTAKGTGTVSYTVPSTLSNWTGTANAYAPFVLVFNAQNYYIGSAFSILKPTPGGTLSRPAAITAAVGPGAVSATTATSSSVAR